jgi:ubiquinone/menaquinone biosynthesis C-methylase UbiE
MIVVPFCNFYSSVFAPPRRRSPARRAFHLGPFLLALLCISGCATLKQCAYEGASRDDWQQPQRVIQSLQIAPGASIADLGAGSGYFTFRLAEAAGPGGRVYAVDVDEDMTSLIEAKARERGVKNIETVLARPDDPNLPRSSIDLVFTSNTYHHIEDRVGYFRALRAALRPGGRVAIIEFNGQSSLTGLFGHYTPSESIKREMAEAGYRLAQEFEFLDRQSFLIFE